MVPADRPGSTPDRHDVDRPDQGAAFPARGTAAAPDLEQCRKSAVGRGTKVSSTLLRYPDCRGPRRRCQHCVTFTPPRARISTSSSLRRHQLRRTPGGRPTSRVSRHCCRPNPGLAAGLSSAVLFDDFFIISANGCDPQPMQCGQSVSRYRHRSLGSNQTSARSTPAIPLHRRQTLATFEGSRGCCAPSGSGQSACWPRPSDHLQINPAQFCWPSLAHRRDDRSALADLISGASVPTRCDPSGAIPRGFDGWSCRNHLRPAKTAPGQGRCRRITTIEVSAVRAYRTYAADQPEAESALTACPPNWLRNAATAAFIIGDLLVWANLANSDATSITGGWGPGGDRFLDSPAASPESSDYQPEMPARPGSSFSALASSCCNQDRTTVPVGSGAWMTASPDIGESAASAANRSAALRAGVIGPRFRCRCAIFGSVMAPPPARPGMDETVRGLTPAATGSRKIGMAL